jgi:hypothetical protein
VAADANHLARAHEGRIRVLHRLGKFGLGTALVQGFEEALDLIGSRYTRGGSTQHDRLAGIASARQILSRLAAAYTDVLLRLPLTDVTGGLRGYRRAALASLDLSQTRAPAGS